MTREPLPNLDAKDARADSEKMLKFMLGASNASQRSSKINLASVKNMIQSMVSSGAIDFPDDVIQKLEQEALALPGD